ncbi:LysR family transcriptional regulator [Actinoplanes sp. OR16]|uniref:LysR family transcriptional regulator n=1 Tax=Actinoplanes sp. OR16 TaxID=946334 RepID=UPI000F71A5FE|nr:LysR family transcriptional regulator [Actinoplanes sp. OR16]BBH69580.1 LysR family transcriptional regulator [Actinoplanes sp. OR16]
MLDVRRLRLLHDLDRLGTIAAVANLHVYTPSAVSQQLSALEREAGVALLERTGRRVTLTAAGRVLVRQAAAVLAALESADAALAAVRAGPSGPLRIGAFPSAVRTILPPALVALAREHPALELMVTELDPAAVPSALRDRTVDAGLTHSYDLLPLPGGPSPATDDLESVPLLDEAVHVAVPSPLADPSSAPGASIADLRERDWVMASPGTLCHEAAMLVCATAGFTPRIRHQADDFTAVLALVAAGQGVALIPALAVTTLPPGVRLLPAPTRRRTRIAYRRGAATHPSVAALTAALHTSAAALPALLPGP